CCEESWRSGCSSARSTGTTCGSRAKPSWSTVSKRWKRDPWRCGYPSAGSRSMSKILDSPLRDSQPASARTRIRDGRPFEDVFALPAVHATFPGDRLDRRRCERQDRMPTIYAVEETHVRGAHLLRAGDSTHILTEPEKLRAIGDPDEHR